MFAPNWMRTRAYFAGGGGGYLNVYPNSSRRKNFHEIFNLLETFLTVTTSKSSKICFFLFYDREQGT